MSPGYFNRVSKLSLSPPISLTNPTVPRLIPIRTGTPGYHRHFWQNQNLQCEGQLVKYVPHSFIFLKSTIRINVTQSFVLGLAGFETLVTISPPEVKATFRSVFLLPHLPLPSLWQESHYSTFKDYGMCWGSTGQFKRVPVLMISDVLYLFSRA